VVVAAADLEMVQVTRTSPRGQEAVLEYRHEWLAQMVTHPEANTRGAWLDWRDGRIVVKNPDDVLIAKMRDIALKLGANVQGDYGERYERPPAHPSRSDATRTGPPARAAPKWAYVLAAQ
jgi:hypothetical protein